MRVFPFCSPQASEGSAVSPGEDTAVRGERGRRTAQDARGEADSGVRSDTSPPSPLTQNTAPGTSRAAGSQEEPRGARWGRMLGDAVGPACGSESRRLWKERAHIHVVHTTSARADTSVGVCLHPAQDRLSQDLQLGTCWPGPGLRPD